MSSQNKFVTLNCLGYAGRGTIDDIVLVCYGPRGGQRACESASPQAMRELRDQLNVILGEETDREVLERASRLIGWMSNYVGNMAPGKYQPCYKDLNEHGLAMQRLGISTEDPSK